MSVRSRRLGRRDCDSAPRRPAALVAAKDEQPPPVREVACHAEQLAQPGSIDGGLAVDGEEVCLALELPQQRFQVETLPVLQLRVRLIETVD